MILIVINIIIVIFVINIIIVIIISTDLSAQSKLDDQ